MTRKCLICNFKSTPTSDVTFYMFPKNEIQRKKWLDALNLIKIPNFDCAYICSNHFDKDSFCDSDDPNKKKGLYAEAIPTINMKSDSLCLPVEHKLLEELIVIDNNLEEISINSSLLKSTIDNTSDVCNDRILPMDDCNTIDTTSDLSPISEVLSCLSTENKSLDESIGTVNRNLEEISSNCSSKKRPECISRKDFVSDEAWNRFLKFTAYQSSKMSSACNKISRNNRKLHSLTNLLADLKKQQFYLKIY